MKGGTTEAEGLKEEFGWSERSIRRVKSGKFTIQKVEGGVWKVEGIAEGGCQDHGT